MEWKRMKGREYERGQGMEVIEKTRWEGDKIVEIKRMENKEKEKN